MEKFLKRLNLLESRAHIRSCKNFNSINRIIQRRISGNGTLTKITVVGSFDGKNCGLIRYRNAISQASNPWLDLILSNVIVISGISNRDILDQDTLQHIVVYSSSILHENPPSEGPLLCLRLGINSHKSSPTKRLFKTSIFWALYNSDWIYFRQQESKAKTGTAKMVLLELHSPNVEDFFTTQQRSIVLWFLFLKVDFSFIIHSQRSRNSILFNWKYMMRRNQNTHRRNRNISISVNSQNCSSSQSERTFQRPRKSLSNRCKKSQWR